MQKYASAKKWNAIVENKSKNREKKNHTNPYTTNELSVQSNVFPRKKYEYENRV